MKTTMKIQLILLAFTAMPFAGNTQALNLDFEAWEHPVSDMPFDNRPVDWFLITPGLTEPSDFGMFYHPPVTAAQNGNYALKLSTWYYYTKDRAVLKAPYTARLSSLRGFYLYEENILDEQGDTITDVAQISVFMTKWNTNTLHRDTIGTGILDLDAAATYTLFTDHITYTDATIVPDSIHILIDPSLVRRDPNGQNYISFDDGVCSFLTVDHLFLVDESVAGLNEISSSFQVYPNPATDFLAIENFKGLAALYDINGKLIQEQGIENQEVLSVSKLESGTYLLQLNDGNFIQNVRIVKK